MPRTHIALSLILTLTLSGAPVVQALAMTGLSAPNSAGVHASHATQQDGAGLASIHNQHNNSCGQHDSCNGSCCASCAQCVTGVPPLQFYIEVMRPVLTPSVHRLFFSPLIALRDRPPRAFSL